MTAAASGPWLRRLELVDARLAAQAARPSRPGLTDPDPASGERWEAAQVWAHMAEFPGYWTIEVGRILEADPAAGAVPFGRTKTDPDRVAAIARDRNTGIAELHRRVIARIATVAATLRAMEDADWTRTGRHPTLGVLGMERIMQEFLVGHLEEHSAQLEGLANP
ncbi:MAG TPA: hypothetical protein VI316_11660 [Candidatus Dormibacteraeota bacterium]